jgi:hypothetical protein
VRFAIDVVVCVEAQSIEELNALLDQVEHAAAAAAGASCIHHPAERWLSRVSVDALDDESATALIADGRWLSDPAVDEDDEPRDACRQADESSCQRPSAEQSS